MQLAAPARRARIAPSLTPLIDVVFILLVFFMLASSFADERRVDLQSASAGGAVGEGDTLVVDVGPEQVRLGGDRVALERLPARLAAAGSAEAGVLVQVGAGVAVQRLLDVLDAVALSEPATVALGETESAATP